MERLIDGLEDYSVTNDGVVYSMKRPKKIEIKKHRHRTGYWAVSLKDGTTQVSKNVHRLVAETFLPNPNNYKLVRFKDGNRDNLHADNLEWCAKLPQSPTREFSAMRSVIAFDYPNRRVEVFKNRSDACKAFNVQLSRVTEVCERSRKAYKGVIFAYYDDLAKFDVNSLDDWLNYHCTKRKTKDDDLADWLIDVGTNEFATPTDDVLN